MELSSFNHFMKKNGLVDALTTDGLSYGLMFVVMGGMFCFEILVVFLLVDF